MLLLFRYFSPCQLACGDLVHEQHEVSGSVTKPRLPLVLPLVKYYISQTVK